MKLSVLIPAYNEEKNLPFVIDELLKNLNKIDRINDFEIIIIDDYSSDSTFKTIKDYNNKKINCIRLSKRSGSHKAIRVGLLYCTGNIALIISADGQDDTSVLPEMIKKNDGGAKVVWALREAREESLFNKLFAYIFYKLLKQFIYNDIKVDLNRADFVLLNRKVIDAINACKERDTSFFGLVLWIGFKHDYIIYKRNKRISGKSKWTYNSKIKIAMDWIVSFSAIPLKLVSIMGFLTSLIGVLYAIVIFFCAIFKITTPGWAESVILILVIGGIQMLFLGIIGEYLWRNYDETRKRPFYFIDESTFKENKKENIQ